MRSAALSAIRGRPKRKTAADPNGQGRLERAGRPTAHARIKNTNRRCAALSATRRHRRAHKKYLGTSFQPIFGIYNFSRRLLRHITVRSACGRADAASRRHSITAPTQHAAPPHHGTHTARGAAASRHPHSTRRHRITAPTPKRRRGGGGGERRPAGWAPGERIFCCGGAAGWGGRPPPGGGAPRRLGGPFHVDSCRHRAAAPDGQNRSDVPRAGYASGRHRL